jgi:hypothetical protein
VKLNLYHASNRLISFYKVWEQKNGTV